MADIKTPDARSKNMSAIRSKDTKPEVYLRKKLFHLGYRYRKNVSTIPGHPDIYLAKYNTAIFVHGTKIVNMPIHLKAALNSGIRSSMKMLGVTRQLKTNF